MGQQLPQDKEGFIPKASVVGADSTTDRDKVQHSKKDHCPESQGTSIRESNGKI